MIALLVVFFLALAEAGYGQVSIAAGPSFSTSRGMGYDQGFAPGVFGRLHLPLGRGLILRETAEVSWKKKSFLADGMLWGSKTTVDVSITRTFSAVGAAFLRQQRNSVYTKAALNFGGGVRMSSGPGRTELNTYVLFLSPDVLSFNKTRGITGGVELTRRLAGKWGIYAEMDFGQYWFVQPGYSHLLSGAGFSFRFGPSWHVGRGEHWFIRRVRGVFMQ